jgi:7,8-dihydropterin-6-yl-methyl-4-(beta-D-ribofuranosyl)aminobenzene 5'-phosphate synthase
MIPENSIQILYDNQANLDFPAARSGWGFSVLIHWGRKLILYDTGWDGDRLLYNLDALNLPIRSVDAIFISHSHWDHAGGLARVLHTIKCPRLYLPSDFSKNQKAELDAFGLDVQLLERFQVLSGLSPLIASTGTHKGKGPIGEQAMVLKIPGTNDCVIIIGCCHPGLELLFDASASFGKITSVIGGLHGYNNPDFLKNFQLSGLAIGHCTQHLENFVAAALPVKNLAVGQLYQF